MSEISNIAAASLMAVSAFAPSAKEASAVKSSSPDIENKPPIVQNFNPSEYNSQGDIEFKDVAELNQNKDENDRGSLTEKEKEAIEAKGGIFMNGVDYTFTVESPLGAYDKYGNYYPGAIPEGGILNVSGAKFKLTYKTGYFDEVTFLYAPDNNYLKAGQIFPYMVFLPPEAYGKAFKAMNYTDSPKYTERDIYTDTREPATYVAMPVITTSPGHIISPYYFNADGDMVMDDSKSFQILPGGTTGSTTGYLSWTIMKLTKDESKDYFDLELLGILTVGSDNKLFMELNDVPTDIVERCNLNS